MAKQFVSKSSKELGLANGMHWKGKERLLWYVFDRTAGKVVEQVEPSIKWEVPYAAANELNAGKMVVEAQAERMFECPKCHLAEAIKKDCDLCHGTRKITEAEATAHEEQLVAEQKAGRATGQGRRSTDAGQAEAPVRASSEERRGTRSRSGLRA